MDVRPHGTDLGGPPWWIVSDLGGEVRRGVLRTDHVLGVGPAAMSLADTVVRRPVGSALDVGTGSGVQALHLSTHARRVVATDVSERALRCCATTWALSRPGETLDLRRGSLLDPVAGERVDQLVANPPFVITPGPAPAAGRFTYRDGGLAGDTLCARLVAGAGAVLTPGGTAQLLANWLVTGEQDWTERVGAWVPDGCDAWIWQRELADLGQYAALWLRDAGDGPHEPGYAERYDAWIDGLRALGAVAVGFGAVHLRRLPGDVAPGTAVVVAEDVVQALQPPLGEAVDTWFARARWLAGPGRDDRTLLAAPLRPGPDLELARTSVPGPEGWRVDAAVLRQRDGLGWEVEADDATAQVVGALDGARPLGLVLDLLAATRTDVGDPDTFAARALPVVRDLVARGLLLPPGPGVGGRVGGRPRVRAVVTRVTSAAVEVAGESVGAINAGLLVLVGVGHDDTVEVAARLARRVAGLRILRDELSLTDLEAPEALVVSQFTLLADTRRGRRPGWSHAAPGPVAAPLVDAVVATLRELGIRVGTGRFGADMAVSSVNDGPVTIVLDVAATSAAVPRRSTRVDRGARARGLTGA